MVYIAIALAVVGGMFFIIKPYTVWKYNHYFSVKYGEPTRLYIVFVRISGVILLIVALLIIFGVVMYP